MIVKILSWLFVFIMLFVCIGLGVILLHNPTFEYFEESYPFGHPELKEIN